MLTITIEFENGYPNYDFINYLANHTWAGAKDRVKDMSMEEIEELLEYLDSCDAKLTDTELNDFIWFEWEDVKREMNEEE